MTTTFILVMAGNWGSWKSHSGKFHENVSTHGYCLRYTSLHVWWEQKCDILFINPEDGTNSKSWNIGFQFLTRCWVITQKRSSFKTMNHGESLKLKNVTSFCFLNIFCSWVKDSAWSCGCEPFHDVMPHSSIFTWICEIIPPSRIGTYALWILQWFKLL